jgi:hypothetical protein
MPSSWGLPCALFGHRAQHEPVWNQGFYFATCCRCGEDIVRIPGERWHRPRRARVIWSATPPASVQQAALERRRWGPLQAWSELPASSRISGPAAREIRQGTQVRAAVREQTRSSIPDFMDDPGSPIEVTPKVAFVDPPASPGPHPARPIRAA